jgi:spermidine synthase
VQKWVRIGRADVPGGGGAMDLLQAGDTFSIRIDGRELMFSRVHGSEDALAALPLARLVGRPSLRVLIGGLGMGFTAAAALARVGADDEVVVAELVPEVVAWNRGPLSAVAGHPLADPRLRVHVGDVGAVIREAADAWDAILLDVDNGPEGLTRPSNRDLYTPDGLRAARRALRPGGILAVWSAAPKPSFTSLLRRADFEVREEEVRERGDRGGHRHTIWLARRP